MLQNKMQKEFSIKYSKKLTSITQPLSYDQKLKVP